MVRELFLSCLLPASGHECKMQGYGRLSIDAGLAVEYVYVYGYFVHVRLDGDFMKRSVAILTVVQCLQYAEMEVRVLPSKIETTHRSRGIGIAFVWDVTSNPRTNTTRGSIGASRGAKL